MSLCPGFITEILPSRKALAYLQSKMEEFTENGCRPGWLIDPFKRVTYGYHPKMEVEEVPFDQPLFGGQVLEGLQVNMAEWLGGSKGDCDLCFILCAFHSIIFTSNIPFQNFTLSGFAGSIFSLYAPVRSITNEAVNFPLIIRSKVSM